MLSSWGPLFPLLTIGRLDNSIAASSAQPKGLTSFKISTKGMHYMATSILKALQLPFLPKRGNVLPYALLSAELLRSAPPIRRSTHPVSHPQLGFSQQAQATFLPRMPERKPASETCEQAKRCFPGKQPN